MKKSTMKYGLMIVMIVFAIVPAVILGAVGTLSISGYNNDVKQVELSTVSLSKAGQLGTVFGGYLSEAATLSKLTPISSAAKSGMASADTSGLLKSYVSADEGVADVLVINASGQVVASADGSVNGTFEHFDQDMPSVSKLLAWNKYQSDAFFVSHEIAGGGYVCLVVDPAAAGSAIAQALSGKYLNDTARLAIIDMDGNTVNFDGSGSVKKSGELDSAISNKKDELFRNDVNGKAGDGVITGNSGKYHYVSGIIPEVLNWRWIGVSDGGEFGGFASSQSIISLIILAVAAIAMCALGIFIVSKFVGKIHGMLKTMDGINQEGGISSTRFEVSKKEEKSELGQIQTSFNEFLDEVKINSDRYRTIANLSDNMLFEWDFRKEIMYISDNMMAKFDLKPEGATLSNGRFLDSLMEPEAADKYKRDISAMLKSQKGYNTQYQLRTKSGSVVWVSFRANCITDRVGEALRVIGVLTDIDNEKKAELQLSERASFDFLSQLYNRSTFIRMLTQELDRRGPNKIAAMFIDIDDFKFVNDRYGHTVGDEVIRFVADNIRKKVENRGGFAGRFGGDEFVLCYTNQDDIANLEQIAMDIIDELYVGYTTADGMLINVRASIGIAYCPLHTEDVNELISFSDTAMYFVKKNGKTNYHVYMPEDSESGEYIDPEGY